MALSITLETATDLTRNSRTLSAAEVKSLEALRLKLPRPADEACVRILQAISVTVNVNA